MDWTFRLTLVSSSLITDSLIVILPNLLLNYRTLESGNLKGGMTTLVYALVKT